MTLQQQEDLVGKISHKFKEIFSPIGALDETAVNDMIEQYLTDHPDTVMTDTEVNTLIEAYMVANPPAGGDDYFTVNPRAVVVQDSSFTETDVQAMIDTYMANVVAQPHGVTAVYNWNETIPSIRGPIALDTYASAGIDRSYGMAYAAKINKLFVSNYSSNIIQIVNGDTLVVEHSMQLSSPAGAYPSIDVTPDGKRLVIMDGEAVYTYDIDTTSFVATETNNFTVTGLKFISIDGIGSTLVASTTTSSRGVVIYKLSNQGLWVEDQAMKVGYPGISANAIITSCYITKDALEIYVTAWGSGNRNSLIRKLTLNAGVYGNLETIITTSDLTHYAGEHHLELSLDKQTMYVSDVRDSTISSNCGSVGVYYLDETDTWVYSQTLRPTDTDDRQYYGYSIMTDFSNSKLYIGTSIDYHRIYKYDISEAVALNPELLLNADLDNDGATTADWVLGAGVFMPSVSMLEVQGDYTNAGSLNATSTRSVLSQDITLDAGEYDLAIDLESYFVNASYDNAEARFYYQLVYGDGTEYFFGIFNSSGVDNVQESATQSTVQLVMNVTQADLVKFEVGILYITREAVGNSGGANAYTSVNINSISIRER